jgi:hypothetical protein
MKRAAGTLVALLALLVAVPAAAGQAGPVTIYVQAATTARDQYAGHTTGSFMMSGRFSDAGTVSTSYRFAGPDVDGMATLIGARGVFTIALRGTVDSVVGGRQNGGGRWRLCGGTGPYKRAAGSGLWESVADFGSAPPGVLLPDMRGAFYGRLARGSAARRASTLGVSCSPRSRIPDYHRVPIH